MKKNILLYSILILVVVYIVFIIFININNDGETTKSDKKTKVVTSFYPMYIAALNIVDGIDNLELNNLTQPTTGCLHDYQLSPQEMILAESADIFIVNGASMESFLDKVIGNKPNLKIIDSSENIELVKDENDEENAHIWVSTTKYISQVKNISYELRKFLPEYANKISENTNIYVSKLELLRDTMKNELSNISNKDIITFHEAFPYFAQEFNLNIVKVIEREPGTEPSASEVAETVNIVNGLSVKALFAEPQYSANAAQVISNETGAKIYILDPCVTGEYKKDAYIDTMYKNLEVLKEALK
ncbi:MAG: metal ABC transporter substrate-binding protein [Clostridia bacterium]|nr:metal ABC transporter substrate-binding protein [Clostridia bacterium]